MENRPEVPRKPTDKRSPPMNGPLVWCLLGIGVVVLVLVLYVERDQAYQISYSDLVQLLDNGSVDVKDPADSTRAVRYSSPSDLRIGPQEVTGKVNRREVVQLADNSKSTAPSEPTNSAAGQADRKVSFHVNNSPVDDNKDLKEALKKHNISWDRTESAGSWKTYWLPSIALTLFIVIVLLLAFRRMGGAGSPMAFGRSRGKMYAQEDLGIMFDDVAGIDEAVDELREVVDFLRTPERYQTLGGRIPKGVLLVGPPGTGKTLLAKAIAGEAGVPFFSLSGSDFVEMFVGVGAARVRDMFQQAEAKAPCIIFIDELDALGKTRGSSVVGGHDEREQTLNALLVEMDGFGSNSGVIVLAATNRPETLDPALLRPGRFDRHVLVDRPDVRGREDILKVHIQNVKLDPAVNIREIATLTSGFVGADLANLVNEAALLAARKGNASVGIEEFNEGVERVTAGLEKRKRVIHIDEKLRVAYHESGHALVAYSLPNTDPVHKVSIIPRGLAALGYTMQRPEDDRYLMTQSELEARIQVLLAGTITEEIIFEDISTGAQNDLERASEIARAMVMDYGMSLLGRMSLRESSRSPFLAGAGPDASRGTMHSEQTAREIDQEVRRIIDESIQRVRMLLEARRASLEALAKRLIEREVIDGQEMRQIIDETSTSPWIAPGTSAERKRPGVVEAPEPRAADPAEGTM
jgi:cell division protease FtsH